MPVRGGKRTRANLTRVERFIRPGAARVVKQKAAELRGRATALAPILTRRLILSGAVNIQESRDLVAASVSFDTEYAIIRHEGFYNLGPLSSRKAPTRDGPVGRKYLQRPFENMLPGIQRDIVEVSREEIRRAIRRGPRARR